MSKIWLVLKNEFITVVTRRSFLLTLLLLPVTSFIIVLVIAGIQKSTGSDTSQMMEDLFVPDTQISLEGFVDQSGLVKTIPPGYSDQLKEYQDEQSAKSALENGDITAYYLIGPNYLEDGKVTYVRPDFNPIGGLSQSESIDALMSFALTEGDTELAYRMQNPINVEEKAISTSPQRDESNPLTFFLPYIVTFLFYIVIITSSSLLLNSISDEKQNRMMEILMTSVTPTQMLTGKITALGLVGLLQTVVWSGSGYLLLLYSGRQFALGDAFKLPPSILLWGILFFITGYAVYASLMAGLGALVPNMREAAQVTTIIIMPLIVPLMFISILINTPDSPLSIFLSLFPLTAPVSMMTRLSATIVPFWQTGLALVLLIGTALLLVRAAAGMFRAQNLLSGKSITSAIFFKALIGK